MENCLVTKLKSAVNNSNLLKIGEFKLQKVNSSASIGNISITAWSIPVECRVLGDTDAKFSVNSQRTLSIENTSQLINTTSEADVAISYEGIVKLILTANTVVNMDDLKYNTVMRELVVRNITGDISSTPESLTSFQISIGGHPDIRGDINTLPNTLTSLYLRSANELTGSISHLANTHSNLAMINVENIVGLTGNVTDLLANNTITTFNVFGTQFVGTAAQIKAKLPNASVTDKDGGTA